jgi:hypothetical protein
VSAERREEETGNAADGSKAENVEMFTIASAPWRSITGVTRRAILTTLSEFASDGELLFSASFPPEAESYRAFRSPWSGQPDDDPALTAELEPDGDMTLYASWNGAIEVTTWEVLAGPDPEDLEPVASVPRKGFEIVITVDVSKAYVRVRAKNSSGRVLGTSKAVKPRD